MSKRSLIGQELVNILINSAVFSTVKLVSNNDDKQPFDLLQTELPAIKMHFTDESIDYNPTQTGMNKIGIDIWMFLIEWDKDSIIAEENLLKGLRDTIGANPRINSTAVDISIRHIVKIESGYPLVSYKINADILYESSMSDL